MLPNYTISTDADLAPALAIGANSPTGEQKPIERHIEIKRDWQTNVEQLDVRYEFTGQQVIAHALDQTIALNQPVMLHAVQIPKPWGAEIWYTGIEARGESRVELANGQCKLSQYLAITQHCLDTPPILLKVLDPNPEPVVGDLYFEVHEQKQEVYFVTNIDPQAWPEGNGAIRLGMNQNLRGKFEDDAAFRAGYLKAVLEYEQTRRKLDEQTPEGYALQEVLATEHQLREAMQSFTGTQTLCLGDIVVVSPWTPHALQHGVRVVEFQTPTYERYIISFAQKVLTQNHWDSETAIARLNLDSPPASVAKNIQPGVAEIVAFDDFHAWRVDITPKRPFTLPNTMPYAVVMNVRGECQLESTHANPLRLQKDNACFVPAFAKNPTISTTQPTAQILVAFPTHK